MAAFALVCSEEWDGTTCSGDLSSLDIEPLSTISAPFDWSLIDGEDLAQLFGAGAGVVLTLWVTAYGASLALDVLRKT